MTPKPRIAKDPDNHGEALNSPRQFFGVFRSLLTAVSLWMLWKLVAPLRAKRRSA